MLENNWVQRKPPLRFRNRGKVDKFRPQGVTSKPIVERAKGKDLRGRENARN